MLLTHKNPLVFPQLSSTSYWIKKSITLPIWINGPGHIFQDRNLEAKSQNKTKQIRQRILALSVFGEI